MNDRIDSPESQLKNINLSLPNNKSKKSDGGLWRKGVYKNSYNNKPLITIITVTYNSEKFLEETIKSIIYQTYDNIEYIVIDGGSIDQTLNILNQYKNDIDYFISEPDDGMYDALNKGFSIARGVLIGFCNSDDLFFSKNTIEKVISNYNVEKFDCCYGTVEYINSKNDNLYRRYPLKFKLRYLVTLGMPFAQPTFFWTKNLMDITGDFDLKYKIASDYDFIGRLLFNAKKIQRIKCCIIKFRKYGASFGDKNTNIALKEILEIKGSFLGQLKFGILYVKFYSVYDRILQKSYQIAINLLNN